MFLIYIGADEVNKHLVCRQVTWSKGRWEGVVQRSTRGGWESKQNVAITMSNTRNCGEDKYDASRRGEGTSRMETKLDSLMEGLHAEDHPELVQTIKTAQAAEEEAQEEVNKAWLAARADGSVARMEGEITAARLVTPADSDNDIEALRKLRLAQMRSRAEQRKLWLERGHGKYEQLQQESSFLEALPKHERAVCALCPAGSMDGELLHAHLRALASVHVETYFCWLDPDCAPVMMGMVDMGRMPALLLISGGKVVQCLHGLDRSFTTEGVGAHISCMAVEHLVMSDACSARSERAPASAPCR